MSILSCIIWPSLCFLANLTCASLLLASSWKCWFYLGHWPNRSGAHRLLENINILSGAQYFKATYNVQLTLVSNDSILDYLFHTFVLDLKKDNKSWLKEDSRSLIFDFKNHGKTFTKKSWNTGKLLKILVCSWLYFPTFLHFIKVPTIVINQEPKGSRYAWLVYL